MNNATDRAVLLFLFVLPIAAALLLLKKPQRWYTDKDLARWEREAMERSYTGVDQ